jgi:acyl carrier protein
VAPSCPTLNSVVNLELEVAVIYRSLVLVVGFMAGCSGQPPPAGTTADTAASRDPEVVVRAAIAAQFKVDPSAIDMSRPLAEAPYHADDLDLVELVMEIEDRLGVTIPDERVEEMSGGRLGKAPIRITPAQLVMLAKQAKPSRKSKEQ